WKEGEVKAISFTISFNRPIVMRQDVQDYSIFERFRYPDSIGPTDPEIDHPAKPKEALRNSISDIPKLSIPKNAKTVDYYVDNSGFKHIFILVKFEVNG